MIFYTDGACKGNPGIGGWGFIILSNDEKVLAYDFGGESNTTNNRMELTAFIKAADHSKDGDEIISDSTYVINGVNNWRHGWRKRSWKDVKNVDLWKELDAILLKKKITAKWVKGHSGHVWNDQADKLANMGVESVKNAPIIS